MPEDKVAKVKQLQKKQPAPTPMLGGPKRDLSAMQPQDFIPDTFPNAQKATLQLGDAGNDRFGPRWGAYSGAGNAIAVNTKDNPDLSGTAGHEAAHAIWAKDLQPDRQTQWQQLHGNLLKAQTERDMQADKSGLNPNSQAYWKIAGTHPTFLREYPNDPSHSFAAAYGQYVTAPEILQHDAPEAYDFIRNLAQFEYSRKGFK